MWGEETVLLAASSAYFLIQEGAARHEPKKILALPMERVRSWIL